MATSSLGSYLGRLLVELHSARNTESAASSFLFLQACGALSAHFLDRYDGEAQKDCVGFLDGLISRLYTEGTLSKTEAPGHDNFSIMTETKVSGAGSDAPANKTDALSDQVRSLRYHKGQPTER